MEEYSLDNLPNIGANPVVTMDIILKGELLGKIMIKLFRDAFPAGVENFTRICLGSTYRLENKGGGDFSYKKQIRRTFSGCKFYNFSYNNYIVCGDIYNNNGKNAGTIFSDEPIPADFGDYYYPHDSKGLVSLIPFTDEEGNNFYDSTFMITLDNAKSTNIIRELDSNQIVIGQVFSGLDTLDKINKLIIPHARRSYPEFVIGKILVSNINNPNNKISSLRRKKSNKRKY